MARTHRARRKSTDLRAPVAGVPNWSDRLAERAAIPSGHPAPSVDGEFPWESCGNAGAGTPRDCLGAPPGSTARKQPCAVAACQVEDDDCLNPGDSSAGGLAL
jgi:hypothetical protein